MATHHHHSKLVAIAVVVAFGCGEERTDAQTGTASAGGTTGSGSASDPTDPVTSAGTTTSASDTTGQAVDSSDDGGPIFDLMPPDAPAETCSEACGETRWSYIFVSNSSEATLSKIDTRTLVEEGRYRTRPDGSGNPSRTSVSIDARAVVVANRMGGVTKFWARESDCEDRNGNGMIDTSTGPGDVLAFADEECVAWHTPFPEATTQRPVAWTSGTYDEETCRYEDQKVWTAAANGTGGTWPCDGADGIHVYLLDGETGMVDEDVHMPDVTCGTTLGPYGAAVDYENDVWIYIWSAGTIVHVDFETLEYDTISGGSYGITVDTNGRVWVDSGQRYDPATGTWASKIPAGGMPGAGGSGVAEDLMGRIWTGTTGGVGWIDAETMAVGDTVPLPDGNVIYRGIAVDYDGFIWAIMVGGNSAHRIDPDTYEVETVTGLNSPYTYSDMAGGQLNSVTCNPPAG
jgi:hypothetical protein